MEFLELLQREKQIALTHKHEIGMGPPALSQELLDAVERKVLDLAYATASPSQKLDLYLPPRQNGPAPVILHFHGGAFRMGDKRDINAVPMLYGLCRGYAVVSAEYRKSGEARFPAMVYDAKAAVRWIYAHAEEYGLDSSRIAVWGPSSGGWLSSFVAVTNGESAFEDRSMGWSDAPSRVHACVDWCGPCGGFLNMDPAFEHSGSGVADHSGPDSPESLFLGAHIVEVPELVQLACPMSHVKADAPPFLIVHGEIDQVVPLEQSLDFCARIRQVAGEERARLHIHKGGLHHGAAWYLEESVIQMALDFLDESLGRS